ncbi:pre-mRNA-splicing factor prp46 [Geranomyces variabilis]|nr:pre-mRNA-splicing factor prp46 [Geranomyces variabilis]
MPGPPRIKLSLNFGASTAASASSPTAPHSEHSQHHGPASSSSTARRPPIANQAVPPSPAAAAAAARKGMTALEAARALGAPIPLRKRSIQPSDSDEDDLIIDDDDEDADVGSSRNNIIMEPYLQAGHSAATPEPSGRIKLNLGASRTVCSSPLPSKAETSYADEDSDDAMMIDIDVDEPPFRPSSTGGKRKFSSDTPTPTSAHVKRVKLEVPRDSVDDNVKMDTKSNGSAAGQDSNQFDSPSSRHPRKVKNRSKGLAQRRQPPDSSKGAAFKPRKKSLHTVLSKLITSFKQKDVYGFFLDPVDTSVVTDYMTVVKEPMDLGTMEKKVRRREYKSLEDFKRDFNLVVVNAKTYNSPDTVYYKAAAKLEAYGNRAIDREEPHIDIVHERTEPRPSGKAAAAPKPFALPELRRLADTKKSSLKKMTHTERLALRRGDLHEPDGTTRKEDSWKEPLPTPFEELINRFSHQRQDSWAFVDTAQLPRGMHDYGPYQHHENLPSTNYILQRDAYGDETGEAYVKSLERFTGGLPPSVTAHASKIIARATRGAHALVRETCAMPPTTTPASTAPQPSPLPPPQIVETEWGMIDVAARIRRLRPDVDRVIREAEVELWRREGVDIVPLLRPKSLGAHDAELAQELETNNMMLLLEKNCADLAAWYARRDARSAAGTLSTQSAAPADSATGGGEVKSESTAPASQTPPPPQLPQLQPLEAEAALAERVRRRLLQLVQKAPPREFEDARNLPSVQAIQSMYVQAGGAVTSTSGSPRTSLGGVGGGPSLAAGFSPATPAGAVPR